MPPPAGPALFRTFRGHPDFRGAPAAAHDHRPLAAGAAGEHAVPAQCLRHVAPAQSGTQPDTVRGHAPEGPAQPGGALSPRCARHSPREGHGDPGGSARRADAAGRQRRTGLPFGQGRAPAPSPAAGTVACVRGGRMPSSSRETGGHPCAVRLLPPAAGGHRNRAGPPCRDGSAPLAPGAGRRDAGQLPVHRHFRDHGQPGDRIQGALSAGTLCDGCPGAALFPGQGKQGDARHDRHARAGRPAGQDTDLEPAGPFPDAGGRPGPAVRA